MMTIFEDNFDGEASGDTPDNWEAISGVTTFQVKNTQYHSSPNSLYMYKYSGGHAYARCLDAHEYTDARITMYLRLGGAIGAQMRTWEVYFTADGTTDYTASNVASFFKFNWDGGYTSIVLSYLNDAGTPVTVSTTIPRENWFKFQVKHNMATDTFDCWIDDTLVVNNGQNFGSATSAKGMALYIYAFSYSAFMYVDDVVIEPVYSEINEVVDPDEVNEVAGDSIDKINGVAWF